MCHSNLWNKQVQKSYTFRIPTVRGSYANRLHQLDLEPLELKRLYADLVEVFKIFHGASGLIKSEFFQLGNIRTRGHCLKLFKKQSHCDERKFFFSNRIVDPWNSLSENTINATSIASFKRLLRQNTQLKKFLQGEFL